MGGGLTLAWIFLRICPHALRALKGDHLSPKSDISPQIFNIFILKHDLRTFVEKMSRVAFTHSYGPNRSGCLDWGVST